MTTAPPALPGTAGNTRLKQSHEFTRRLLVMAIKPNSWHPRHTAPCKGNQKFCREPSVRFSPLVLRRARSRPYGDFVYSHLAEDFRKEREATAASLTPVS